MPPSPRGVSVINLAQRWFISGITLFAAWCVGLGLIPQASACPVCFLPRQLTINNSTKDHHTYVCHSQQCAQRPLRSRTSFGIRENTIFADSRLNLLTITTLMCFYDADVSVTMAAQLLGVARNSVYIIYNKLDTEVLEWMLLHPLIFQGLEPIQIDEVCYIPDLAIN